ncbi:endoplasmic reticulum junction formation protein lunapark-A-like isoform X4 [Stegodyphus dumicola]|uniref:endoplasmic reticulum junction formation protein lunapark-A-like isoform X4 n=1 Tax=Stegodyphus dumicola TaxID=202533 RepID=UPI0015A95195|nr:endoplasmic reticulum junction formation protein lunapark-A-like isoform X4 [Stegodyphus dumicola]
MGVLFSRFRSKPSTKELLEELEKEIEALEEYKRSTELQQKAVVRSLVFYSVLIYIIVAGVFLFYSFPVTTRDRIVYSIPLLVFPLLLYILKKFLHWYFLQKIRSNDQNLIELKRRKKSLLEFAMETETYKIVKELLERFDPEYHRKVFEPKPAIEAPQPSPAIKGSFTDIDLRRRNVSPKASALNLASSGQATLTINSAAAVRPPAPPMPRPVLPRERTFVDRIVDYLVGDGPSNRYALICRQCQSHNGMALKEEFEFIAFRCCYCFHWNPPRNQQPPPPRLSLPAPSAPAITEATSEISSSSEDTEIENLSDADISASPNTSKKSSVDSTKDVSMQQRLSVGSENEIQANLEEDRPFIPSDSNERNREDCVKCDDSS